VSSGPAWCARAPLKSGLGEIRARAQRLPITQRTLSRSPHLTTRLVASRPSNSRAGRAIPIERCAMIDGILSRSSFHRRTELLPLTSTPWSVWSLSPRFPCAPSRGAKLSDQRTRRFLDDPAHFVHHGLHYPASTRRVACSPRSLRTGRVLPQGYSLVLM
jgi:hypothetical protein